MNKQIYITRKIPEAGLKLLREKGITFDMGISKVPPTKKEIIKALKKKPYNGVISFLTDHIDAEVFDACSTAKVFANFSVGFDNFDLDEAKKRNICISNTPGTSATAVAEHTVALMLALTTRLVEGDKFMCKGKFKGWDPNLFIGTDMKGKTIGLIGAGQIGTEVAKILHYGFGSKIIYSDISPNPTLEQIIGPARKETAEILRVADIVSLHVPLLPTTHHLINKETLATMKKTAFLINTSRGPVVDEKALVYALENNIIRGAALDVFEFEPKLSKGLIKLPDVIITPHIASARQTARDMMAEIAAKNIISALETGIVINSVIK
ncbi:MAG: D-glycerate dehydrogenase [Candidatus Paceibacterota bacterium]